MNKLEELIRSTLAAHEGDAATPGQFLASSQVSSMGRGRNRLATLSAIGIRAVLVLGVGLSAISCSSAGVHPAMESTGPAVPEHVQPVSFHGVQVFVPSTWRVHDTRCGEPMSDTAIIEIGAEETCSVSPSPSGLTVVRMTTPETPEGRARASVATQPVTVDGHPGRRGVGVPPGEKTSLAVLVIPDPGVVVSVESSSVSAANNILDAAHVVPIDSYGCRDHMAVLTPSGPSDRADTKRQLVPGSPANAAICFYTDNWLGRSLRLIDAQMSKLRDTLNELPEGTSFSTGSSESPELCLADTKRGYVLRFTYANGPTLDIYVHIGGCNGLSASNGSRTTKINASLVSQLSIAGYDASFPNPNELQ